MARTGKTASRNRYQRQTAVAQARPPAAVVAPAAANVNAGAAELKKPAQASGELSLLERAAQQILAVTYWFDPVASAQPYPLTIRFTGRRTGVPAGQAEDGDAFIHDETIAEVVPGSGPIAVTAKVRGVNAGEWEVRASVLESARAKRGRPVTEPVRVRPVEGSRGPLIGLWRRWAPSVHPAVPVKTHFETLSRVPGLIPMIWGAMAGLGIVVAVIMQAITLARLKTSSGPALLATLIAIAVGVVGAKVWYIVKHWERHDAIGWTIQGFIFGASAGAIVTFWLMHVPLGTTLDAAAPGLMLGVAVGRIGCFFAGCCGGPPTAARWGVWCSDQHVGARRVPTQLMESLFCLLVGLATLAAVWTRGPAGGAYFVAVVAAYTLFREGILRLRAEPLALRLPVAVIPVVSALVLVGALVIIVR
jgi:phosphatidylglycerol:prolipoprotein diacylglycerol transferase